MERVHSDKNSKKEKQLSWESLRSKEVKEADAFWLQGSTLRAHPILALEKQSQTKKPSDLHEMAVSAKDFIREKFDTFKSNKGKRDLIGRNPYPNELLGLIDSLITFVVSIFEGSKMPQEEWLTWAFHVHDTRTLIDQLQEHFTTDVTKTGLKKLVRSFSALLAQFKAYFGSQQWQKFKDLEIMPKTYFSSNVLVDEDLPADSTEEATFQEENLGHATPKIKLASGSDARNIACPHNLLANEIPSNSPDAPDISTVRKYASNMRSAQGQSPATTPMQPHVREDADDDLDIATYLNIHGDDLNSEEDAGSSSDLEIWDYDLI
jgi:hypothetical protein